MQVKAIEKALARERKLRAQLDATEAARKAEERKAANRRKYVVGGMVLKAVENDGALKAAISKIVGSEVLPRDRDLLSDFLSGSKQSTPAQTKPADTSAKPSLSSAPAASAQSKPNEPPKPASASAS